MPHSKAFNAWANAPPIHPAYLAHLPDDKVNRAVPERDPAQTNRLARRLHGDD